MTDETEKPPSRFDLSRYTHQIKDDLPPPGRYPAIIENIDHSDKTDVVWLFADWKVEGFDTPIRQILAVEALEHDGDEPDFARRKQLGHGLFQLLRICKAAGINPEEQFNEYADFQMLIGTNAEIVVGHRNSYGVPEATVKTVFD